MAYFVYLLVSKTKYKNISYVGYTNNLNKRLDKIKKEKSPEFKGEKDGMEFYEIDGNPVIRKLDDEIFDEFDDIGEYTRDYINDAEFNETSGIDPYWDKHILMPNASGLKKLNK